ncbi:MAG: ribosome small subunit-dependent GTPase A [Lachnospiraceae bacterium]|nr:ribosome small subunit-dependent GTPase A [Lachnospiraceae bacterium]
MTGKIVKGISGFYYVHVGESGIYQCKAKGIFRQQNMKPLVGDDVEIEITHEKDMEGNIIEILPRKNELVRPMVANIDQALIMFASAIPKPNFNLLDRFLVMMGYQEIPVTICFNKSDQIDCTEQERIKNIYRNTGYKVVYTSALENDGIEEMRELLKGKTSAVAGPSGVGKSSLINAICPEANMEIGEISKKIERGKNTTRHTELVPVGEDTYIMDTPGFSTLYIPGLEKEDLWRYFPEFFEPEKSCRFVGCSHISEPDCGVKEAVKRGDISKERYKGYKLLYEEIKNERRF